MKPSARLWAPGYLVALFLVAAPVTDLILRVSPMTPSSVEWRYGVTGFISLSLEAPLIGLFLALVVAGVLRHDRTVKALGVLALLGSVTLVALGGVFALDAQQMRSMLNPAIMQSFQISALLALTKYGLAAILVGLMGWVGLRLGRRG